ncbi:homocysteine S-methyltransferase family protein [Microbacterium saperdae]|uniref:Homocysteine S-methyltransferase n=1 Tax=Microbacterium saperdae TaxID=69368 RepID=A0A543BQH5_9MICO|nr:homocysteine S-methyltransferase family protein [Microbacterium saperdae]TQL87048.1 homocysteine S-methyltransferase [Microbacterium saperdae]GGM43261.1 homocysteine S-methyltransferase [Microbacterium saperdae]
MSASDTASPVRFVTDGGLETDLIFHHGVDLPDFAAFVLVDDFRGRRLLQDYYRGYAEVAGRHGVGLRLESATWRASADWGRRLDYDAAALRRVNIEALRMLRDIASDHDDLPEIALVGVVGPRGDGYRAGEWDPATGPDDAYRYHRPQVRSLAEGGADAVTAYTLSDAAEAIGVVRAAREFQLPVEISFTVETDGRLPSGRTLAATIADVDAHGAPDGYLLNCAHPEHFARAVDAETASRIIGIRPNASRLSHAELDEAEHLDEGDPADLAACTVDLVERMPSVRVIGGCCGTDARHVTAIWERLDGEEARGDGDVARA